MKRALVLGVLCVASVARAAPPAVLVLRAEGTADTASRTSIDTHVLRLAKNIQGNVDAGDITLTEAAALIGCSPSEASCKNEVLTTLGVDEVVAATVTATPSGLNVTVRRIARNSARAAQTTIAAGSPPEAKMTADIGPLFGVVTSAPPAEPKQPVTPVAPPRPPAAEPKASPPPAPPPPTTTPPQPPLNRAAEEHSTEPIDSRVTAAPSGTVAPQPAADAPRNRRFQKIGMGIGGGFLLLSFLMWSQADDVQGEIDGKPEPRTPADFIALRDLEKRGDDIAAAGNLFFLTGALLGGVSTYLYIRAGRSTTAQTARIAPAAFPSGAGVTLTIGGTP